MDIPQQKYWKVDLIGDSCHDIYHYGSCDRLSPEAPVPILKELSTKIVPGMSWNVRLNLESFGIFVMHYTNEEKIKKHRFIDSRHKQHLFRWDEGEEKPLNPFNTAFLSTIRERPSAVVISDYDKGFLPPDVCCEIVEHYKKIDKNIHIFVDSKKTDLSCFEGCYIKINDREYENITKHPKDCRYIITLGASGTRYLDTVYETNKVEVFDVCGAGDVFLSALTYGYLINEDIVKAIEISNRCASYSVTKMGTYVISREELKELKVL